MPGAAGPAHRGGRGDRDRCREALGVDVAGGGAKTRSTPARASGVAPRRAGRGPDPFVELGRVDEQRDQEVGAGAPGAQQREVPGVEKAHGRDQHTGGRRGGRCRARRSLPILRMVLMRSRLPRARGWRRRARRRAPRSSGVRSAIASRWRATSPVAAHDRPGERRLGPQSAPSSRAVARTSGASCARSRPRWRPAAPRRPPAYEEVRRDRGGGVVGGAVLGLGQGRPHPEGAASPCAVASARVAVSADRAPAPRRAPRSLPSGTVVSGCSEKPCGAPSNVEPVAPEQWPTSGPGGTRAAAAAICPSGHAQQHDVGVARSARAGARSASRSAAASAVPRRPAPTTAQAGRAGGFQVQFSHRDTGSVSF